MKKLVFAMAGFAMMLFSGNLHAQVQGGMDSKPDNKPQVDAKSRGSMRSTMKHEKRETQGNDVKLERSGINAKADVTKPKNGKKEKPKKSGK